MHKFDIYQFAIRDLRKVNFSSRYSSQYNMNGMHPYYSS